MAAAASVELREWRRPCTISSREAPHLLPLSATPRSCRRPRGPRWARARPIWWRLRPTAPRRDRDQAAARSRGAAGGRRAGPDVRGLSEGRGARSLERDVLSSHIAGARSRPLRTLLGKRIRPVSSTPGSSPQPSTTASLPARSDWSWFWTRPRPSWFSLSAIWKASVPASSSISSPSSTYEVGNEQSSFHSASTQSTRRMCRWFSSRARPHSHPRWAPKPSTVLIVRPAIERPRQASQQALRRLLEWAQSLSDASSAAQIGARRRPPDPAGLVAR